MAALEFVADKRAGSGSSTPRSRSARGSRRRRWSEGLIARAMPHGDILGFSPPLVVTPAESDEIVASPSARSTG